MIEGVKITPLKQFSDERGKVMHMLKSSDLNFKKFGEIYFSSINPGAVKDWHQQKVSTINYAVPSGQIKLILYDDRLESPTQGEIQELTLGIDNYCLVTIPPMVWSGFKCHGSETALLANCATFPHKSDEVLRLSAFDDYIPYDWKLADNSD
jgi:dTDP-4-dehydrorhamnose 3,5-epimerase